MGRVLLCRNVQFKLNFDYSFLLRLLNSHYQRVPMVVAKNWNNEMGKHRKRKKTMAK